MKMNLFVSGVIGVGAAIFVLAVAAVGCSTCAGVSGAHQREAETQAQAWTKEIGLKARTITCAGTDSDGDGYVSCTIVEDLGDRGIVLHAMECAGAYNFNRGCRVPKLQIPRSMSGE